jgi:hypothetical protein
MTFKLKKKFMLSNSKIIYLFLRCLYSFSVIGQRIVLVFSSNPFTSLIIKSLSFGRILTLFFFLVHGFAFLTFVPDGTKTFDECGWLSDDNSSARINKFFGLQLIDFDH